MKTELSLQSTNKRDNLHVVVWTPDEDIKGIVQISHGMEEYVERFDNLARVLNENGYLCIGNDHIGHGKTAACKADLGYFGSGMSKTVVDDLYKVTKYAKEKYGNDIPFYLFGHSMGSFMARRYIMTYGGQLDGVILSGTGFTPDGILSLGKFASKVVKLIKGSHHKSKLLQQMAFGAYNKKIQNSRTTHDWLTKDDAVVDKYLNDPLCAFSFTVNGYETLFDVLSFIQNKENVDKIPKELPIYIISGDADPVGDYGKGVQVVYNQIVDAGVQNVTMKLYEGDRHELTNEFDREQVFEDIIKWISKNNK